jgi:hypothetical protein
VGGASGLRTRTHTHTHGVTPPPPPALAAWLCPHWLLHLCCTACRQGDRERAAGMPVSPLMDRTRTGICESQVRGLTALDCRGRVQQCIRQHVKLLCVSAAKPHVCHAWLLLHVTITAPGAQVGFFEIVGLPLFRSLAQVRGQLPGCGMLCS